MAIVEHLANSDQLPASGLWVLVDQDPSRGNANFLMDMMLHGSGATFYVTAPFGEAERRSAVDKAKAWADFERGYFRLREDVRVCGSTSTTLRSAPSSRGVVAAPINLTSSSIVGALRRIAANADARVEAAGWSAVSHRDRHKDTESACSASSFRKLARLIFSISRNSRSA